MEGKFYTGATVIHETHGRMQVRSTASGYVRVCDSFHGLEIEANRSELTLVETRHSQDEMIKKEIDELRHEFKMRVLEVLGVNYDHDAFATVRLYGPGEQDLSWFKLETLWPDENSEDDYLEQVHRIQLMQEQLTKAQGELMHELMRKREEKKKK